MKNIYNCVNKWLLSVATDFSHLTAPEKFSAYFATIEGSDGAIDDDALLYISHKLEPSSRSKAQKEVMPTRKMVSKIKTFLPNVHESPLGLVFEPKTQPAPPLLKKKDKKKSKSRVTSLHPSLRASVGERKEGKEKEKGEKGEKDRHTAKFEFTHDA
eukprot:CAMPEP_0201507928 /NCGR_PEP_ID=MMETSP0161_2-20130828/1433_1 /ASSEMBLY_ACC=CAM_ASM_000251 /TAXON_ID=180227 /ORGANISM="Neoparamoeba aestuarina, Strain SoJaBio B1-5/56/2" /LENGTH=156 /DNA_ID=CAMNT_0047902423 /DNA_START=576 /DNA_END=1046 /DNA_ORIENTATION=-